MGTTVIQKETIYGTYNFLSNDWITSQCSVNKWYHGHGQPEHKNIIDKILPMFPNEGVMLDVGGYVGTFSIPFLLKGMTVHTFEPRALHYELLQKNLKNFSNSVTYNNAVGNTAQRVGTISGGSSNEGSAQIGVGDEVDMITLDSLDLDRVDFIKIDVEGFEYYVLQGAINTIKKHKPVILWEKLGHKKKDENIFNQLGEREDCEVLLRRLGYTQFENLNENILSQ